MWLRGNIHAWFGCTKTRSPEIETVLHRCPPDVDIFGTDPSLVFDYLFDCVILMCVTVVVLFSLIWVK